LLERVFELSDNEVISLKLENILSLLMKFIRGVAFFLSFLATQKRN